MISVWTKDAPVTPKSMKIAGVLAMTSACVTLPLAYLSYQMEGAAKGETAIIQAAIQISGTFLFVAIVLFLKKFINDIYNFTAVNRNLDMMIIADIVTGVLTVIALCVPSVKDSAGYAALTLLVMLGIVQVQFGYKLLKLPDDLGGLLKPFCFANMATGILLASILLIPLGILVSAVSDLMLGTIFLNTCKLFRTSEK